MFYCLDILTEIRGHDVIHFGSSSSITTTEMSCEMSSNRRDTISSLRLTAEEREQMEAIAAEMGITSLSEYIRYLHRESMRQSRSHFQWSKKSDTPPLRPYYSTQLGTMYLGDSLEFLHDAAPEKSVDLIMTSPPFGLVRKKSYGNEDASRYCDWFRPFAEGFRRVLKDNGSLVIDIGGAWKSGYPTRSLYHFELLIMLCREYGFHLCQEHYCWNPSRLPAPAEWVNVRRIRVKDAVNCVWWLSPSPWPKANNRRVLAPYSDSMLHLLKNGYKAKLRPSGHDISDNFSKDNGGAVPPNLLAIANTESNSRYQSYCREHGLPVHPARFPALLPEYFIRFLTEPNDFVLDPFGGSCVTGAVAEALKRRWACVEITEEYLQGAIARFEPLQSLPSEGSAKISYQINAPCAILVDDEDVPLFADGGQKRPTNSNVAKAPHTMTTTENEV